MSQIGGCIRDKNDLKSKKLSLKKMDRSFDELKISTITVMVYSNIVFNYKEIYDNMVPTSIIPILTKKGKQPKIKDVRAPEGDILSLRYGKKIRGLQSKIGNNGKAEFPNQTSLYISLGDKNAHLMIFKSCFKVAACRTIDEVTKATSLFWNRVKGLKNSYSLKTPKEKPTFILETVMNNVDFKLGFNIDRKNLNDVMNSQEYKSFVGTKSKKKKQDNDDAISFQVYETTSSTQVPIKMFLPDPEKIEYQKIVDNNGKYELSTVYKNYLNPNPAKPCLNRASFMVFRSSKVIESTRLQSSTGEFYNLFMNIIRERKDEIKEILTE